jgi:hypothetical protein
MEEVFLKKFTNGKVDGTIVFERFKVNAVAQPVSRGSRAR